MSRSSNKSNRIPLKKSSILPPEVLIFGSSTGGPEALKSFFSSLTVTPSKYMLLVQHMPPLFTSQLALMLDGIAPFKVKEAQDGEPIYSMYFVHGT